MNAGPPILLVGPQNTIVKVGSAVSLSCSFLAKPNDGGVRWKRKNGANIISSDRHQIFANGTLFIKATTDTDSGEYQCIISNSKGIIETKANLTVISKFTI